MKYKLCHSHLYQAYDIFYRMGRLCGGAHELSGIKAPIFLHGWVVGGGVSGGRVGGGGVGVVGWEVVGWVVMGWVVMVWGGWW